MLARLAHYADALVCWGDRYGELIMATAASLAVALSLICG